MTSWQPMRFDDQVVVITGAASGIGAAATDRFLQAGAQVHALDVAPVQAAVASAVVCDLGRADSIDEAVTMLPARIDALVNCAGVPNGGRFDAAEVMAINWLGLRHLTELLVPRMAANGSVTNVASTAGRQWPERRSALDELLACSTFDEGIAWVEANPATVGDGYAFSKEVVQYYTLVRALELLPARGVRMNSVCPGITNTRLVGDFRRGVGDEILDRAEQIAGRLAEPAEMAPALLFLADHTCASYVNGVNLNVDRGTGAAHATGRW